MGTRLLFPQHMCTLMFQPGQTQISTNVHYFETVLALSIILHRLDYLMMVMMVLFQQIRLSNGLPSTDFVPDPQDVLRLGTVRYSGYVMSGQCAGSTCVWVGAITRMSTASWVNLIKPDCWWIDGPSTDPYNTAEIAGLVRSFDKPCVIKRSKGIHCC